MICPNCGGYIDDAYPTSNVDRGDMINAIYDCGCGAIIYANIPRMDGMLTEPIVHHFRVIRNKEQFQDRPNKERTFTVQRNGGFTENVPFSVLKSEIPGIQAMRIGDHAIGVSGELKAIRVSNEKPRKKKPMSFCPKCKQYERIPMRRVNVGPGKIAERIECCNCGYVEMMPIAEWMARNDDERINWRDYQ